MTLLRLSLHSAHYKKHNQVGESFGLGAGSLRRHAKRLSRRLLYVSVLEHARGGPLHNRSVPTYPRSPFSRSLRGEAQSAHALWSHAALAVCKGHEERFRNEHFA